MQTLVGTLTCADLLDFSMQGSEANILLGVARTSSALPFWDSDPFTFKWLPFNQAKFAQGLELCDGND